jgi:phospholipid transport system substrate-binding protein
MPTALNRRALLQVFACGLVAPPALLPCTAHADETGALLQPVQSLEAALLAVMKAGHATSFVRRFDMLAPAVDRSFSLPDVLRMVVGLRWGALSAQQQSQLLATFRRYTVATWVANFDSYSGERFETMPGAQPVGNGDMIVQSRIVPGSGAPTRLDFVMRQASGEWRAVDLLADGSISRVAVMRSDFRRLLSDPTGSALVDTLQRKVADLSGGAIA